MIEPEIIGFMVEGDNVIVANPCTIPIKMLREAINKKRKKNEVTYIGGLLIKFPINFDEKIKFWGRNYDWGDKSEKEDEE